jgi:pimeloyl-ACP methyl ester carboxylesterase
LAGIGELGQIAVRSPHLALGYLDDDRLTGERFITNPFTRDSSDRLYLTGDLGRYRPDGNVEFAGRSDRQVKVRGFRVELAEVEAALAAHPSVEQAYVSLDRDDADGRLVAHIASRQPGLPAGELRQWLRERLPESMVPAQIVLVERMPLTPNGKVDVAALLREGRAAQPDDRCEQPPALTELESRIAAIWCDVLGIAAVRRHDNFLDLGGHSLLALRAIARLEEELGLRIAPRTLLFQTLGQIAQAHAPQPNENLAAPGGLQAIFFGRANEELFGCYHPPIGPVERDCGVLLCAPLGHEYVRTHRAYRQLACRLSEAGFHVLRFDYFGCGDSAGEDGQTSLARLLDDLAVAADELRRRSGASGLCLGGWRMGATLAALAACRRDDVDAVLLCDPVIRGDRYLAELSRWHRQKVRSLPQAKRPQEDASQADSLLGFRFSQALRDELQSIDLRTVATPPARGVLVLDTARRSESRRLAKHFAGLGTEVDHQVEKDHRIWQPALDKILVPARVIDAVARWLSTACVREATP